MAEVLIGTIDCHGIVVKVYAEQVGADVQIRLDTILDPGERADLLGFFIDFGNDGGSIEDVVGEPNANMNGSDSCTNEQFDKFDFSIQLGSNGGPDDYNDGTFTIPNITLASLNGAQIGIRAQSVVTLDGSGETSLKMSTIANTTPPPPEDDHFAARGISHVILLLEDENGANLWVKIDDFGDGQYDLDDCLDEIQDWIADTYAGYSLTGLAVKQGAIASVGSAGTGPYTWYDLDDNNADVDTNAEFTAFWTLNKDRQGNIAGSKLDGSIDVVELCPEMAPPPPEDLLIAV